MGGNPFFTDTLRVIRRILISINRRSFTMDRVIALPEADFEKIKNAIPDFTQANKRVRKLNRRTARGIVALWHSISHVFRSERRQITHVSVASIICLAAFAGVFATPVHISKDDGAIVSRTSLDMNDVSREQVTVTLAALTGQAMAADLAVNAEETEKPTLPLSGTATLAKAAPLLSTVPAGQLRGDIQKYTVQPGDTASEIAGKFGITTDTVLNVNGIEDPTLLKQGQVLLILPVSGVLHTVIKSDSVASIAAKYSANAEQVISLNELDFRELQAGEKIIVPGGQVARPATSPRPRGATTNRLLYNRNVRMVGGAEYIGNFYWGGKFRGGYCTSYVSMKKNGNIPWNGNAYMWDDNARAMGVAVGTSPRPGSIWVMPYGSHVGLVESVHGDGSFTITDGNYAPIGYGKIARRTLSRDTGGSFIYW